MDNLPPDNSDSDPIDELSKADMLALLSLLRTEHRAIDLEIKAMIETGVKDMLKIKRMKKIKLKMKDKITFIENLITPDIIA
jgi:hypothetical protein